MVIKIKLTDILYFPKEMRSEAALVKISKQTVVILMTLWLSNPKKFFKRITVYFCKMSVISFTSFFRHVVRINSWKMEKCYLLTVFYLISRKIPLH